MYKAKVLHISNTDFFICKLMLNKLIGLREKGYVIHAMAPEGEFKNKISKEIIFHDLKINRAISPINDVKSIMELTKFLKKEKFDIVHTHSAKAGIIGRIAAWFSNTPIIIHTSHGLPFYEGQSLFKYNTYKYIEKMTGKISTAILSQNHEDIKKIIRYNIGRKENVYYEGNGVNIRKLDKVNENTDKEKLIEELGIKNKTVLGFYARLEPVKGHLFFLEAFKEVVNKSPGTICLLAGSNFGLDSSYEQVVLDKIKELNLTENIIVLGFREDIHNLLSITDILVLPSQKEGIPRIVMEAMSFKKPVVATDVLGTRELVKNNYNGFLVPYLNVDKLHHALLELIESKDLRTQFGSNGRKYVEQEYNEETVIERLDKIYSSLLHVKSLKQPKTKGVKTKGGY